MVSTSDENSAQQNTSANVIAAAVTKIIAYMQMSEVLHAST